MALNDGSTNGNGASEPASASNDEGNVQQQADAVIAATAAKQPGFIDKPTHDDLAAEWYRISEPTAWGMGEFRRYALGIWKSLSDDMARHELLKVIQAAKTFKINPTGSTIASVREVARAMKPVDVNQWDADTNILVCKNGTLHLPTRALRAHSPDDYQTSAVDYDYNPAAVAPVWTHVLNSLEANNPGVSAFLQEFSGYCLTTDTKHEIAVWLAGKRGSGKSTIIEGFQAMLGQGRCGLLGLGEIEKSTFALWDAPGKTLFISTEQPANFIRSTHVINAIISGEQIRVERKYHDAYPIRPTAKILWAMNEMPRVASAEDGIMRRVKVIQFKAFVGTRDETVKEAVRAEGPGIMNWALDGLARLTERGRFVIPKCIEDATEEFEAHNDIPRMFIEDECLTGAQYSAGAKELYDAYKNWCITNGHKPQASTNVVSDWLRLGFVRGSRTASGKKWLGVGLIDPIYRARSEDNK